MERDHWLWSETHLSTGNGSKLTYTTILASGKYFYLNIFHSSLTSPKKVHGKGMRFFKAEG